MGAALRALRKRSTVTDRLSQGMRGSVAREIACEFATLDLTLAAFKVIQADRAVQIGCFRFAAGRPTWEQILEQDHDVYSVVPPCRQYAALRHD